MTQKTDFFNIAGYIADCIVCAAGASSRMEDWKPLLPWGNGTLVDAAVDAALAGGCRVILVTGMHAEKLEARFVGRQDVIAVRNDDWKTGMVSSIQRGCDHVASEFFFVVHADMPLVPQAIYRDLLDKARRKKREMACENDSPGPVQEKHAVWRPRYKNVPGHPVLFARESIPAIAAMPIGESMKPFLGKCSVEFLETGERGVVLDLDEESLYLAERERNDIERSALSVLVLTGSPGSGKTTRIGGLFARAATLGLNAVLVRQTATGRLEDGRAAGFDMELVAVYETGETKRLRLPLARRIVDAEKDSEANFRFRPSISINVGPYVFDRDIFEKAREFVSEFCLKTNDAPRFLGIDEIGKLELERSEGLMQTLGILLRSAAASRERGCQQYIVCSARYDTLDKLEEFLSKENFTNPEIRILENDEDGPETASFPVNRRRFPLS